MIHIRKVYTETKSPKVKLANMPKSSCTDSFVICPTHAVNKAYNIIRKFPFFTLAMWPPNSCAGVVSFQHKYACSMHIPVYNDTMQGVRRLHKREKVLKYKQTAHNKVARLRRFITKALSGYTETNFA